MEATNENARLRAKVAEFEQQLAAMTYPNPDIEYPVPFQRVDDMPEPYRTQFIDQCMRWSAKATYEAARIRNQRGEIARLQAKVAELEEELSYHSDKGDMRHIEGEEK